MRDLGEFIARMTPAFIEQFQRKDHRSMLEIWQMLIKESEAVDNEFPVNCNEFHERYEDMSINGKISVGMDNSGDMVIAVIPDKDGYSQSVEFCTGSGGGKSQHTRRALFALAKAIQKDNAERPIKK